MYFKPSTLISSLYVYIRLSYHKNDEMRKFVVAATATAVVCVYVCVNFIIYIYI